MKKFFRDVLVVASSLISFVMLIALFQTNSNIGTILIFVIVFYCGYFWGGRNREKKFQKDLIKEFENIQKLKGSK